jgi:hypothetical protein
MLNRNGVQPVAEKLKASGVTAIGATPIEEANADQIGEFLASVYEAARMTQAQAPIRKNWLAQNHQSLAEAVKIIPDLTDPKSASFKAAQEAVQQNPLLRNNANWPILIVKHLLGTRALEERNKPATQPAPAVTPKIPARPSKPAPGAPKTSTSAIPRLNGNDALKTKMADGTATLAEVQEYTRGHVAA